MAGAILLVTWAGGGNVGPFVVVAEELAARGHRVGAVAPPSVQARLASSGCRAVGEPAGFLATADEVRGAVAAFRPDVLVVDYMLTAALCGAEATGLPTVALVHTLHTALLVEGAPAPIGMAGSVDDVNGWRRRLGLSPIGSFGDLLAAAALIAVTSPRWLDGPGEVGATVCYAGPLVEGPGPDAGWRPPAGDGPLVAVSLGTAGADPANERAVLDRVLDALRELRVRGVVNLPGYLDPATFSPPAGVVVTGFVRHAAVLPHVDVLVTHGGLGSVTAALVHGVPMVVLPLDREQPANAAAVVGVGAGESLDPSAPAAVIADAISRVVARPRPEPITPDPSELLARITGLLVRD